MVECHLTYAFICGERIVTQTHRTAQSYGKRATGNSNDTGHHQSITPQTHDDDAGAQTRMHKCQPASFNGEREPASESMVITWFIGSYGIAINVSRPLQRCTNKNAIYDLRRVRALICTARKRIMHTLIAKAHTNHNQMCSFENA